MEIYINIDGVIRNTIQKFDHHYKDFFLSSETENEESFEYGIEYPIHNDSILDSYKFQSNDEYLNFAFVDYSMEIFGHAGLSYMNAITELNNFIYENKEHNVTLIGLDHLGKSKPATLFFLSKNAYLGNIIKFTSGDEIPNLWEKCDLWITDNEKIIDMCPSNKKIIKFNTDYNKHFTNQYEIDKFSQINKLWLEDTEKNTTLILTQ